MKNLDEMKELFKAVGLSNEAADEICVILEEYSKGVQTKYEELYNKKLQSMKDILIEDYENEKEKLAKKTRLFIESKMDEIERFQKKNSNELNSKAHQKLLKIMELVEDIQLDENHLVDVGKIKEENEKLKKLNENLQKEQKNMLKKFNEAVDIADKLLRENAKLLAEQNDKTQPEKPVEKPIEESKKDKKDLVKKRIAEIKQKRKKKKLEESKKSKEPQKVQQDKKEHSESIADWITEGIQQSELELQNRRKTTKSKSVLTESKKSKPESRRKIKKSKPAIDFISQIQNDIERIAQQIEND
ncbi:MAG: hypothetical protein ACTSYF_07275 [Promethearchaeota archaeon]